MPYIPHIRSRFLRHWPLMNIGCWLIIDYYWLLRFIDLFITPLFSILLFSMPLLLMPCRLIFIFFIIIFFHAFSHYCLLPCYAITLFIPSFSSFLFLLHFHFFISSPFITPNNISSSDFLHVIFITLDIDAYFHFLLIRFANISRRFDNTFHWE